MNVPVPSDPATKPPAGNPPVMNHSKAPQTIAVLLAIAAVVIGVIALVKVDTLTQAKKELNAQLESVQAENRSQLDSIQALQTDLTELQTSTYSTELELLQFSFELSRIQRALSILEIDIGQPYGSGLAGDVRDLQDCVRDLIFALEFNEWLPYCTLY